ncbi:hypothetical protein LOK49_LG02G02540 [Camellia lanceoleosa]|uniref:Uncharacterized protein n=1 Tax=Camellia lanceoleosa TaxID=1840588 RepID=A0ACC0ILL3_9ERIC|nr:hypothetical protein LOK49_LG02G02540 [Camellia lanceoleosa]
MHYTYLLLACFWWPSNPTFHNEVLSTASAAIKNEVMLLGGVQGGWFHVIEPQEKTKDIDVTSPDFVKISFRLSKNTARARFGENCEAENWWLFNDDPYE